MKTDAVILAGGRASDAMAQRTGTPLRALFPYREKPFVQWVYEALRMSEQVGRIAIVGPPELQEVEGLKEADLLLPERESILANLFGGVEALNPQGRVLITACDNPLLSTAAFDDLLARAPHDAAVAYPILRHAAFLERFPTATNVAIRIQDGAWIGGGCAVIQGSAVGPLRQAIERVLLARKSLPKMVGLLGPVFAMRFALKRVTVPEVEQRLSQIVRLPIRFVRDCDPVFPIDIDDPEDWDYLHQWAQKQ